MTKLIDLSMEVSGDMLVLPRVAPPIMAMLESWEEFATGIGAKPAALGKIAIRKMHKDTTYRILIAHGANPGGARELRRYILEQHTLVHSCHISEAGPALGVHLGPGGLVVGFLPQPDQLN